jgi:hypothetical protein
MSTKDGTMESNHVNVVLSIVGYVVTVLLTSSLRQNNIVNVLKHTLILFVYERSAYLDLKLVQPYGRSGFIVNDDALPIITARLSDDQRATQRHSLSSSYHYTGRLNFVLAEET